MEQAPIAAGPLEATVGRTGWMLERKAFHNRPASWWKGGREPLIIDDDAWTTDPNSAVVWADVASATATLSALLRLMGRRTQAARAKYLESAGVTEHIWVTPNGEVRGASRLAGEASSAEGATSTVVLGTQGD